MKIFLELLGLFFIQPVFWIGVIRTFHNATRRLKNSRKELRKAIFPERFELQNFIFNFFIIGLPLSIIGAIIAPEVSLLWVLIYSLLSAIALLIGGKWIMTVTIPVVASIVDITVKQSGIRAISLSNFHLNNLQYPLSLNYLVIVSLILITFGMVIRMDGGVHLVPMIFRNLRNNLIAGYPFHELSVVPFLMIMPGSWFKAIVPFWPVLDFNGHSFSFICLPIVLGLNMTILRNAPRKIFRKLGKKISSLGILGLMLSVVLYILSRLQIISLESNNDLLIVIVLLALLLATWLTIWRTKRFDEKNGHFFSEPVNGVRVIGVEPNTPADKMGLEPGDIILDVNEKAVNNEDKFYERLLIEPTYCRLRVKDRNGELRLAASAIYNNSPHEIGVILFKTQTLD